jgi:hypothetical protein
MLRSAVRWSHLPLVAVAAPIIVERRSLQPSGVSSLCRSSAHVSMRSLSALLRLSVSLKPLRVKTTYLLYAATIAGYFAGKLIFGAIAPIKKATPQKH